MVRLSQKAQVTLFGICVAGLIFGGAGYAQAKSVEAKYEEQTKQLELYKQELDEAQSLIQENTSYKAKYECIQIEKQQLEKQVEELQKWRSLGVFIITAYWYGEDEYGDLTATGVRAQVNHTIAVDPKIIPYGSEIMIDGQIYVAEDCGGAVKNNVIDVWVEHQSNSFGVKYKEIYIKREWI